MNNIKRLNALSSIQDPDNRVSRDFDSAFYYVAGYITGDASHNAGAAYPITDLEDLFSCLLELKAKEMDPNGGNREESK